MPRKLTVRQAAVLAALERIGRGSILDLQAEVGLMPSAMARVLDALESRGLVARAGNPSLIYAGGVDFWPVGRSGRRTSAALEVLASRFQDLERITTWVDEDRGTVCVLLPLDDVLAELIGADGAFNVVRERLATATGDRCLRGVEIQTETVLNGPAAALLLTLAPAPASSEIPVFPG